MRIDCRIALLTVGVLISAVSLAEEPEKADASDPVLPSTSLLPESLLSDSEWRLPYASSEIVYAGLSSNPQFEIEFKDNSTLKQLSKLRNLSLMTLSEKWNSQVFIGVNEEGLVGLHFTWLPRRNTDHILELARLPHLKESETEETLTIVDQTTKYPR